MPRKRGNGQHALYYVRSRKLWKGVVHLGYGPDGKRLSKEVTSRTQSGARDKLDAVLDEIRKGGAPLDKQTTVAAWAETWLRTICQPKLKPNSLAAYESITRNWIIPTIGTRKVALLKPSDIRAVQQAIMKAGLNSATARKGYNVLNRMIEEARVEGLIGRNVVADVDAPKLGVSPRGALTSDQALAILRTSSAALDGSRWWVALLEGLRQGERLGAQLEDLDLERGILRVSWSLDEIPSEHGCGARKDGVWPCGLTRGASCPSARLKVPDGFEYRRLSGRLCLVRPKSGKVRDIPIAPPLVPIFERYLEATKDMANPHGLIWRNIDGTPILPDQDAQAWRDLLFDAGLIDEEQQKPPKDRAAGTIAPPTPHTARHTTATVLMELGVDAKIIGEVVGHQSEKVTRGYQHVTTPAARDAMERISEHFMKQLEE